MISPMDRPSRTIADLFGLLFWPAMVVQASIAIFIDHPWLTGDSDFYLGLVTSLEHGAYGWLYAGGYQPDALRPPGYPIILWLLLHRLHLSVAAVVGLQLSLYLAAVLMIDRRIVKLGYSSLPFRLLALIYPFGAIYCGFVMTEAWATFALAIVALLITSYRLTVAKLALAGLVAGLATLFRGDLLLLPLAIVFAAVVRDWRSSAVPAIAGRALIPILAAAAVLAPYALWNARHFDRLSPIPVASAVGNSLYLATWQGKVPLEDLNALYGGVITPRVEESGLADEIRYLNSSIGADPLTPPFNPAAYPTPELQRLSSAVFLEAAKQRIVRDPGSYVRHVVGNVWALWNTSTYPAALPAIGRIGLTIISGMVYIMGLVGLLLALKERQRIAAAGLVLLYPMAIHLPLHTEARYTAAVRPLLMLFASFAILWLVNCYRSGRWRLGRPSWGSE
jgi:hypothetical protein